ncbi:MAG TPA: DNA-3-methyladenine glycosylase 2 family protein [Ignavibacteria bacterium]|nr:DNA-3-methyladenine glycosylase 2 family protein [Ignavibacteria bacterium]HQY51666.1 DNA-3-methyladenine glycosylase 2 family protein [Ignavibacteria bacterium]HRA99138.1 DNA-3-methyladenine glycosylase 2 family protein [Ignavibacteria bacterium]
MVFNKKDKIIYNKDIDNLFKKDKIFSQIHDAYGSPENVIRPQGFITLSKIIIGQQVSLESANSHFLKLSDFVQEFTPAQIIKLSDTEMRNCYITRQKSEYLRSLSNAILNNELDLENLSGQDQNKTREILKKIKGIGDWTADIYLMFALQAKDIFPAGDVAVINAAIELTGCKTKIEVVKFSEKWKPYRSLASFFLWHYYLKKRKRELLL